MQMKPKTMTKVTVDMTKAPMKKPGVMADKAARGMPVTLMAKGGKTSKDCMKKGGKVAKKTGRK